jgi:hypothetical protein
MLVALGRLAPTAIEQGDGGADLSGRREGQRKPRSGPAVQHLRGAGNHANTRDSVVETVPSRLLIAVPHRPAAII